MLHKLWKTQVMNDEMSNEIIVWLWKIWWCTAYTLRGNFFVVELFSYFPNIKVDFPKKKQDSPKKKHFNELNLIFVSNFQYLETIWWHEAFEVKVYQEWIVFVLGRRQRRDVMRERLYLWHSRIIPYEIDSSLCK